MALACNLVNRQLSLFIENIVVWILESFFELFDIKFFIVAILDDVLRYHGSGKDSLVSISRTRVVWMICDITSNICFIPHKTIRLTSLAGIHVQI